LQRALLKFTCLGLLIGLPAIAPAQVTGTDNIATRVAELTRRLNAKPVDSAAVEESSLFGIELLAAARFADAVQLFAVIRQVEPDNRSGFYGGALALFNLGRANEAEPLARAAVEKAQAFAKKAGGQIHVTTTKDFGNEADALVLLGVVLAVKGDEAGALAAVKHAVAVAPGNFDAQFALGRALYGAGDPTGAARAFRIALGLKPQDPQAQFFLASALERAGDDEGAIAAYRKLIAVAPGRAEGHLGVGVLLVKRSADALSEGIRELQNALAIDGSLYEGQVALGRALIRAGRVAESVAPLKRAAELAPDNPEPHYQLAIAYRRLGQKDAADAETAIVKKIHAARRTSSVARSEEGTAVVSKDQHKFQNAAAHE